VYAEAYEAAVQRGRWFRVYALQGRHRVLVDTVMIPKRPDRRRQGEEFMGANDGSGDGGGGRGRMGKGKGAGEARKIPGRVGELRSSDR
jgi:hypothetical protein